MSIQKVAECFIDLCVIADAVLRRYECGRGGPDIEEPRKIDHFIAAQFAICGRKQLVELIQTPLQTVLKNCFDLTRRRFREIERMVDEGTKTISPDHLVELRIEISDVQFVGVRGHSECRCRGGGDRAGVRYKRFQLHRLLGGAHFDGRHLVVRDSRGDRYVGRAPLRCAAMKRELL